MTRPHDWFPLAEADPVPGDTAVVAGAASHYGDIAERIRRAAANLLSVANETNGSSDALDAFREKAADVRLGILKAETRYSGLADALGTYAPSLESAQETSVRALRMAQEAQAAAQSARASETRLSNQLFEPYADGLLDPVGNWDRTFPSADQREDLHRDLVVQQNRAEQAEADLASARSLLSQAIEERDSAAERAIQQIDDVEAVSPVRDQWYDKVRDWAGKAADFLMAAAEFIGDILDKVSWLVTAFQVLLFISFFIPGVGGVVGALVAAVSLIAKALTLVSTIVTVATAVAVILQVIGGRRSLGSGLAKLGSMAAVHVLGKAMGKFSSKAFQGASTKLQLSEKMRFVSSGTWDPEGRAAAWASNALHDESVESLFKVYGRSTESGQDAIRDAAFRMILTDTAETVVTDGIGTATDFVLDGPPVYRLESSGQHMETLKGER